MSGDLAGADEAGEGADLPVPHVEEVPAREQDQCGGGGESRECHSGEN